jgi:hypothetical protein
MSFDGNYQTNAAGVNATENKRITLRSIEQGYLPLNGNVQPLNRRCSVVPT